uniref:MADS-box transcription factor 23-like isoform X3 n=1 Tax=Erigeron canadensis TaxID=72917 RepID=UPI001CB8B063|nr:MADS-box transcription factor 23-like isoform X3 [Erigeron canadensis]
MGRRKLEMKRIEDKSSRQVTFSKRRSGLFKKARHLSLLCEVDIAVIVFSAGGKLYEFSAGASSSSNSVEHIISRYQKSYIEAEERTTISADKDLTQLMMEYISTLQEEQRKLIEGKEEMEKQVNLSVTYVQFWFKSFIKIMSFFGKISSRSNCYIQVCKSFENRTPLFYVYH